MEENEVTVGVESTPDGALLHIQEMTVTWEIGRSGLGGDRYDKDVMRGYIKVSPEGLQPLVVGNDIESAFSALAAMLGCRVRSALVEHVDALYAGTEHNKKLAVVRGGGTSSRVDAGESRKGVMPASVSGSGSEVF